MTRAIDIVFIPKLPIPPTILLTARPTRLDLPRRLPKIPAFIFPFITPERLAKLIIPVSPSLIAHPLAPATDPSLDLAGASAAVLGIRYIRGLSPLNADQRREDRGLQARKVPGGPRGDVLEETVAVGTGAGAKLLVGGGTGADGGDDGLGGGGGDCAGAGEGFFLIVVVVVDLMLACGYLLRVDGCGGHFYLEEHRRCVWVMM